jgi:HSP20 family protein
VLTTEDKEDEAMNSIMSRWDPFRGLTSLQDQVNRLFEDTVQQRRTSQNDLATWAPAADIYETESELVAELDLPGIQEKEIDIHVENNTLTIRGERKFEKEVNEDNYLRVERAYGTFTRSFSLPNTVKIDGIRAGFQNGVLTVRMPKREESKPKQIRISVSANGSK